MSGVLRRTARTAGMLGLLSAALPANLTLTSAALLRGLVVRPERAVAERPRTVLVSGGKMTKALQLARSFHRAGHRVVLVETAKYRLTGHRFSRSVDRFLVVPDPRSPDFAAALRRIVEDEGVDVFVPVTSPVASHLEALAAPRDRCDVVHADAETVRCLDDKADFAALAASLGLPVPDTHRVTDPAEVESFDFDAHPGAYVLKSVPYDPVNRLDLTPLPRPTAEETSAFARSKPISPETPWILQQLVVGTEYCTHSTVRDGVVQVWCCCRSSAFQLNYEQVDKPAIEDWVRRFVGALGITGQVSFDFIEAADGTPYAIECNPRTHSAITMLYDHPGVADAYLEHGVPTALPTAASRPTYWAYWELWRALSQPRTAMTRLRTVLAGKDAIFDWDDPLPFLLEHHLQLPALLLRALRHGTDWVRIDVNIGKLVEAGGD